MQTGEQFSIFPLTLFEAFGKEVGGMEDKSCWGDDKLDLNANRRKNAKKKPRKRRLRLKVWDLGLMFPSMNCFVGMRTA